MKMQVDAIDAEMYKRIFVLIPNSAARSSPAEQTRAADQVFQQCIGGCGKASYKVNATFLGKSFFSNYKNDDPQIELLRKCESFLESFLKASKAQKAPWWLTITSRQSQLIEHAELMKFAKDAQECKFVEVFVQNTRGQEAHDFVGLCQFLTEAAKRNCSTIIQIER